MQESQEMWVWSLGQEHLLEKEIATHSSTFTWKIPWTEESGWLDPMGVTKIKMQFSTWACMQAC